MLRMHTVATNYNMQEASIQSYPRSPSAMKPTNIPLLPIGAALRMKGTSDPITSALKLLKRIRLHNWMHIRDEGIEPESQSETLSRHHQLRENIGDHFLCDAELHIQIP